MRTNVGMVHDLVDTFPRVGGTKDEPVGPPNGGRRTTEANFRHSSFVVGQMCKPISGKM
jgi:hypothetical protein